MKLLGLLAAILIFSFIGCSSDDDPLTTLSTTEQLTLNLNGLEDLGGSAMYEGWILVPTPTNSNSPSSETAISTGTFTVNSNGELSKTKFDVDATQLDNATSFVLTIEPNPDPDQNPSATHIIGGDFSSGLANLSVEHGTALGMDFFQREGNAVSG